MRLSALFTTRLSTNLCFVHKEQKRLSHIRWGGVSVVSGSICPA